MVFIYCRIQRKIYSTPRAALQNGLLNPTEWSTPPLVVVFEARQVAERARVLWVAVQGLAVEGLGLREVLLVVVDEDRQVAERAKHLR